jgi:hypothetical protein
LGGSLGGRKLRDRWENEMGQDVAITLGTKGCCIVATHRSDWRKKTGGLDQEAGRTSIGRGGGGLKYRVWVSNLFLAMGNIGCGLFRRPHVEK